MKSSLRRMLTPISTTLLIAGLLLGAPVAAAGAGTAQYVVVAEAGASTADVRAAVGTAGGTITASNKAIGTYTVTAPAEGFILDVSASRAVLGATYAQRTIGNLPDAKPVKGADPEVEQIIQGPPEGGPGGPRHGGSTAGMDPLDDLLWGLEMVKSDQARQVNAGDGRVLVGILNSGIDASHPDLAGQLETSLSQELRHRHPGDRRGMRGGHLRGPGDGRRQRARDARRRDGCGGRRRARRLGCRAGRPPGQHPRRAGQRLPVPRPGHDALTYGADIGADVINMSFYVDPWLYNCPDNPADSPEAQAEQRAIIAAMNRALDYAHSKHVTLVGSLGNNHEDLGHPRPDASSPDYPPGSAYLRTIDNVTCVDLPVEGPHVIGISALGPCTRRPTTRTTASSRSRCPRRAAGSATGSGRLPTGPTAT